MERRCSLCGTTTDFEGDGVPSGWSVSFTERGVLYQCEGCVREHVRSIEARLSEEHW